MPSTAEIDITDIVKPHYERGMQQGRQEGVEYGIEQGMEQGIEKARIETARQLKKKGMDNQFIQEVTGLSKEQIAKL